MAKELIKGNEALAESCLRAGCRFFSGYPITPQSDILEYLSWRMDELGGSCVQTESELAGINMLFGAASAGARALTTTSGPGFSLKQSRNFVQFFAVETIKIHMFHSNQLNSFCEGYAVLQSGDPLLHQIDLCLQAAVSVIVRGVENVCDFFQRKTKFPKHKDHIKLLQSNVVIQPIAGLVNLRRL